MEAKVDVRKLQVLNDRINQTIDALNQVRLSVHGLGHTGGQQQLPFYPATSGYGMQQPFGFQQQFGVPQPFGMGSVGGFPGIPGLTSNPGFQHNPYTSFGNPFPNPFTNPFTNPAWSTPWNQVNNPWAFAGSQTGIGGGLSNLYGGIGGLGHSTPDYMERQLIESRANDPFRITQTFPFVVS